MSVNEITLADPTNPGRPAEKVLRLSVVGDLAFVNVSTVDEGNPTTTMTVVAEMVVSRQSLRDAMVLLCQDTDRESLRPSDEHGPLPSLAGQRFVVTPA